MKFPIFNISKNCNGCAACVIIAKNQFEIDKNEKAFVKKQPETEEEFQNCIKAITVCPIDQISYILDDTNPILADSKIKETLDKYPDLIDVLMNISSRFKIIQNPIMYNTLIRFTTFNDFAKYTHVPVCEILILVNEHLGLKDSFLDKNPDCKH